MISVYFFIFYFWGGDVQIEKNVEFHSLKNKCVKAKGKV